MKTLFFLLTALLFTRPSPNHFAFAVEKAKCSICGMEFKPNPKASFISTRASKEVQFCSFSCAYRFHSSQPKTRITVSDFITGEKTDTSQAYFLVRSKKILSELEFEMPPTIVGFASRENADKTQQRLGDGKILVGFDAVIKEYN